MPSLDGDLARRPQSRDGAVNDSRCCPNCSVLRPSYVSSPREVCRILAARRAWTLTPVGVSYPSSCLGRVVALLPASCQGLMVTPQFQELVGTSFVSPETLYGTLWNAISGGKQPPINMEKALDLKLKVGKSARTPHVVVILDEIDQLMSRNQQVLRKLFEWAFSPNSRLVSPPAPRRWLRRLVARGKSVPACLLGMAALGGSWLAYAEFCLILAKRTVQPTKGKLDVLPAPPGDAPRPPLQRVPSAIACERLRGIGDHVPPPLERSG